MDPDEDLVDHIASSIAKWSKGTNLFTGPVRAASQPPETSVPYNAVFCLATGGPPPTVFMAPTTQQLRISMVQVRVRSDPNSFAGGQSDARGIRNAVQSVNLAGYLDVRVQEQEPIYLGSDEDDVHEWSINVEMEHQS